MKILLLLLACAVPAAAEIVTEEVDYTFDGAVYQGYFAYDDAVSGKRPAVMVVHTWLGHGGYVRRRARELAAMGYLAFANDMYGKGKYAKDHEEAAALAGAVRGDYKVLRARAAAGIARLREHPLAAAAKTAAIGYCFGGSSVLELARSGADLKAVVSFHGNLDTKSPAKKGAVKAVVSVQHGGADTRVGAAIPEFEKEMNAAGADWWLSTYSGAKHGFTEREHPEVYDAAADRRSWAAMQDLFREVFR